MKRMLIVAALGAVFLLCCLEAQRGGSISASTALGDATSAAAISKVPFNVKDIAILHWYAANTTTSFSVGSGPQGVAFDGADIWVANSNSNTVTKLQANNGAVLGTFAVGTNP